MKRWRSTFCIRLMIALYVAGMLQWSTVTLIHDAYHFILKIKPTHELQKEASERSFTHSHGGSTHSHSLFVNIALQSLDENVAGTSTLKSNTTIVEITQHFCTQEHQNQLFKLLEKISRIDPLSLSGYAGKPQAPPPRHWG